MPASLPRDRCTGLMLPNGARRLRPLRNGADLAGRRLRCDRRDCWYSRSYLPHFLVRWHEIITRNLDEPDQHRSAWLAAVLLYLASRSRRVPS
jgi:hypothetical protein